MKKLKRYIQPKSIQEARTRMLEYLSKIQDLVDLHAFMQDDDLAEAMDMCLKIAAKPDMPISVARSALAKMQAWAMTFKMKSVTYTFIHTGKAGTDENIRKNVYYSASEQCHEMAQTLKYLSKELF